MRIKRLEVVVLDPQGEPIPDADIEITGTKNPIRKTTTTHEEPDMAGHKVYALWSNNAFPAKGLSIHYEPPEGYWLPDEDKIKTLDTSGGDIDETQLIEFRIKPVMMTEATQAEDMSVTADAKPLIEGKAGEIPEITVDLETEEQPRSATDTQTEEFFSQVANYRARLEEEELARLQAQVEARNAYQQIADLKARLKEFEVHERLYAGQKMEENAGQKLGDEVKMPEYSADIHGKNYFPDIPPLEKCLTGFRENLRDIVSQMMKECDLCNKLANARRHIKQFLDVYSRDPGCDAKARQFLKDVFQQVKKMSDECKQIFAELDQVLYLQIPSTGNDWDCWVSPTTLQSRMQTLVGRLGDLMVAYKGVYDLIMLQVSSQLIPATVKIGTNNREVFEEPFECYRCIQSYLSDLILMLEIGPIGSCLEELANLCEGAVESFSRTLDNLKGFDQAAMPPAASEFTERIAALENNVQMTCKLVTDFIRIFHTGQNSAGLSTALEQARRHSETVVGLMSALREDIRLQHLMPGWLDRARWLHVAGKGLTKVWDDLTELVRQLHDCIELIDSGADQIWQDYSVLPNVWYGTTSQFYSTKNVAYRSSNQAAMNILNQVQQTTTDLSSAVQDIAAFMPLKNDGGGGGAAGGGGDGSFAERRVANTIAAVAGRPLTGDPKSFRALLNGAFPEDEKTGQIVREPVRWVVSLNADQGLLAAGQDILHHEVLLVVNDALKVLAGLRSIGPDTDQERAFALTEMIDTEFKTLAEEASRVDRPRRSRVDEIFQQMTGSNGHLQALRHELELNSAGDTLVNQDLVTRQEAQLIAQMDLLDAYAETLQNTYQRYFNTPTGRDPRNGSFSGRLAFVTLLLPVIASEVRTVEAALEAVDFSHAERRTTFITDPVSQTLISIDGVLSWIYDVATREGPDTITRSGLIGLNRVLTLFANRLQPLLNMLISMASGTTPAPHPALRHSRPRNALQQLNVQFSQLYAPGAPGVTPVNQPGSKGQPQWFPPWQKGSTPGVKNW